MIRITFEAADRESLINSIAQFMLDENYTRPDPVIIHPEVGEPEADEPVSAMPTPPKADPQPQAGPAKEDVRALLIDVRSHEKLGATALRELMHRYKATTFDDINPDDYAAVMTDANEMLKEAANNG